MSFVLVPSPVEVGVVSGVTALVGVVSPATDCVSAVGSLETVVDSNQLIFTVELSTIDEVVEEEDASVALLLDPFLIQKQAPAGIAIHKTNKIKK